MGLQTHNIVRRGVHAATTTVCFVESPVAPPLMPLCPQPGAERRTPRHSFSARLASSPQTNERAKPNYFTTFALDGILYVKSVSSGFNRSALYAIVTCLC